LNFRSTANAGVAKETSVANLKMLPNDQINPIFAATVQATEEAIILVFFVPLGGLQKPNPIFE